jgi:hypothetical protein
MAGDYRSSLRVSIRQYGKEDDRPSYFMRPASSYAFSLMCSYAHENVQEECKPHGYLCSAVYLLYESRNQMIRPYANKCRRSEKARKISKLLMIYKVLTKARFTSSLCPYPSRAPWQLLFSLPHVRQSRSSSTSRPPHVPPFQPATVLE